MPNTYCVDISALDSFEMPVARFNSQGILTYANRAGELLLGARASERIRIADLFPDEEERHQVQVQLGERLQGKASAYRTSFQPIGKPGQRIPISVYALPDSDSSGQSIGSLVMVRDLRVDLARDGIHRAIETSMTIDELFNSVGNELARIVPFDEFRVTTISKSRMHLRTMYSSIPAARLRLPHRWWPMPAFMLATFEQTRAKLIEVDELLANPDYVTLLEQDEASRRFFTSGVRQVLSLPVLEGNRVVAFVGLDARHDNAFNAASLDLLQRLPLSEAVTAAMHHEAHARQQTLFTLVRDMSWHSNDVKSVAETLVQRLAECFGWEHVSIFQNDTLRDRVRLVCQSNKDGYSLPDGFSLPRSRQLPDVGGAESYGAIARAALTGEMVNVPDTSVAAPSHYVRGVNGVRSELAIPMPGAELKWVLNVESKLRNAFAVEEIELLEVVANETASVLQRSAMFEMQAAVLGSINDTVVETDAEGRIRWCNDAATKLLGAGIVGQQIDNFIADASLRAAFPTMGAFSHREVELRTLAGRIVLVLMSGSILPGHLDGRVYVASDLTFQKELQRVSELKEVFRHAAMEGRVPLALAATWLEGLPGELPELRGQVDKVLSQLARADLPLERLLRLFSDGPTPPTCLVDLRSVVEATIAELPEALRNSIEAQLSSEPLLVNISFSDLQFCVESILSFGLRTRPKSQRLQLVTRRDSKDTLLRVCGAWAPDMRNDREAGPTERWRRKTLHDLTMGTSVIERVVAQAGGRYTGDFGEQLALEISLPLATVRSRP